MKSKSRLKLSNIVTIILVMGSVWVYYHFQAKSFHAKIMANKRVSIGKIIQCEYKNKQNYVVRYLFETRQNLNTLGYVNGKEYSTLRNIIVNKTFPVVYDSLDPNTNFMLILPSSFQKYDIDFPDSLRWVLPYLN